MIILNNFTQINISFQKLSQSYTHIHTFAQTHTLPIWLAAQMVALGDARGQKDSSNQLHTHTHTHTVYNVIDIHVLVNTCMHKCSICGSRQVQTYNTHTETHTHSLCFFLLSHTPNGADVSFIRSMTRPLFVKPNFHFKWERSLPAMCTIRVCVCVYVCAWLLPHEHALHIFSVQSFIDLQP